MKGSRRFSKRTRSRGALDTVLGSAGIRDQVIGQYRQEKKRAWESPDLKDQVPRSGSAVPFVPPLRKRRGMSTLLACTSCGRTKDLWKENNGEGISKGGRHYCCKPCSQGEPCVCREMP